MRARFYNPVIGRFTQEDIYRGDGLNLYAYCANNPIIYYDPSGLAFCPENKQRIYNEYKDLRDRGYTPKQSYDYMKYKKFREEGLSPTEAYNKMKPKGISNPEAHNYVNYLKYKGELAKSELKEMYPDFVAKKNSRIAKTSDKLLKNELDFASYGNLDKVPFDNLTGHHMPSNYYMKEKFNIDMDDSLAFNLEQISPGVGGRHRRTFTYGFKGRGKELYLNLMPRDALAFDINDVRRILKEDGLYNSQSRKALTEYIEYYKKVAPGVLKK